MKICIIGTGYVGLVSAACFAEMGNDVCCIDVNPEVVASLNKGIVHIFEPGLADLVERNHREERLVFTTSLKEGIEGAAVAFICVGTPSREDGSCDLSYVRQVAGDIGAVLESPIIVVDKSTVPVGTADMVRETISTTLQKRGADITFDVVSNPEFLKEGDAVNDFMKPDRIILGSDNPASIAPLRALYSPFARTHDKIIAMSVRSAEMTKYAANCMLATKISFINEIANICEKVGANVRDVRLGIGADHRIGYQFIYPGLGYGGSCFPKDVKALIHTAREAGVPPLLLESVDRVNDRQKRVMARRVLEYFAPRGGVAGKTLALWGLAFKANTDDMRESASLVIIDMLTKEGMRIVAYDPEAGPKAGAYLESNPLVRVADRQYEALAGAHALLVATDWNQFRTPNFDRIKASLLDPAIFDGRNLYSPQEMARKGFVYFSVGKGA